MTIKWFQVERGLERIPIFSIKFLFYSMFLIFYCRAGLDRAAKAAAGTGKREART
jgi:hypothetical protein